MGRRLPSLVCILTLLLATAVSTPHAEAASSATTGGHLAAAFHFVVRLFNGPTPASAQPAAVASTKNTSPQISDLSSGGKLSTTASPSSSTDTPSTKGIQSTTVAKPSAPATETVTKYLPTTT